MDNTVINELAERGKKRGSPLTGTEVLTALEGVDCEIEELENLCEELEKQGVDISGDAEAELFSFTDMDEDEEQLVLETDPEEVDELLAQEGLQMDDPVRMYLKDIGKVPLLSADKELELAYKMSQGRYRCEKSACHRQPQTGGKHSQALYKQGNVLPRPDTRGKFRPDEGGGQIRL